MAVPPTALSPPMNSRARAMWAASAAWTAPKSPSASVEKRTISKRSAGFRLFTQYSRALRACSIFSPAMLPEVSKANTTSLGAAASALVPKAGDMLRKK